MKPQGDNLEHLLMVGNQAKNGFQGE